MILQFAMPLILGLIFQKVYYLADTVIVGRILGVQALAGVGATGSVSMLVIGFCNGCCAGMAIPVARSFGAGARDELREYAANEAWVFAVFAGLLTVTTVAFCRPILRLMNTPEACFHEAYRYIVVIFAGIPFTFLYNLLSALLRALGNSRTPLIFLILSALLNVVLDIVLILPLHMGVAGAALATVVSQGVSGLLCLALIARRYPALHPQAGQWRLKRGRIRDLLASGLPMGLQCCVTGVGGIILQTAVNSLGTVAVAAMASGTKIYDILCCPSIAISQTMATYGAQNTGARQYRRLDEGVKAAIVMGVLYGAAAFAFACAFGGQLAALFVGSESGAAFVDMTRQVLLVFTLGFSVMNVLNTLRSTIQGMGYSVIAMMSGVMELAARILAALLLVPRLRFFGACIGSPLAWLFAAAFLVPTYIVCRRRLDSREARGPQSAQETSSHAR